MEGGKTPRYPIVALSRRRRRIATGHVRPRVSRDRADAGGPRAACVARGEAFVGVRGSPGAPGTRSEARETNPKPETRPRRSPGFFLASGREALAGGVARGETHHASAAPEQSRAWPRPRARRGRKQQQTSWTARDERMANCSVETGKKRETWLSFPSQFLRARFFLRLSAHIRDWHFRFLETIYIQEVKHFYRSSRDRFFQVIQTFAKWRRYRGDVCRAGRFVDFASRGGGAFPAQRSQRDGDAREVSVFVRRRGRVSDARR